MLSEAERAARALWVAAERERLTVARRTRARRARAFADMLQELSEELRESIPHQFRQTNESLGLDETDDVEESLGGLTAPGPVE